MALRCKLAFLLIFGLLASLAAKETQNLPPISPAFVFDHWVWEDDENTEKALWEMIQVYERHGIPVGAVIIDSPWATEYNNFVFDRTKYPDPKKMIDQLHRKGIKVVVWATAIINKVNRDRKGEPKTSETYKEALSKGYLLNGGKVYKWWKGKGAAIDITNPEAIEWWHRLQDRVLDLGIDGYKVDEISLSLPSVMQGKFGKVHRKKYMEWYYKDFLNYGRSRNPSFVTLSRSADVLPIPFAPISHAPATWTGDENHSFGNDGFLEAIHDVLYAAELGYTVIGTDIGGYHGDQPITKRLLIRWAQFAAFTPLMENGGHGEHEPWLFDQETVQIYRTFVKLHLELKPFFYSLMVKAHEGKEKMITPQRDKKQFLLGKHLLVSILYEDKDERTVYFPEGEWLDFWNGKIYRGPSKIRYDAPLSRYPVFLKTGAIIPLDVKDAETGHGGFWSKELDTFLIVAGRRNWFEVFSEGRRPFSLCLHCREINKLELRTGDNGRGKLFIIENVSQVREVKGNYEPYQQVASLAGIAEKGNVYYFDSERRRLWVRSSEKAALSLTVD